MNENSTDKNMIAGWLCLDKPDGMSSNSAMAKVRRIFGINTGYIGTLDPFATGVLPIAIGECRKFIPYVEEAEKIYDFTVVFGKTTDTLDKYGKISGIFEKFPSRQEISEILPSFHGTISQIPPVFSAIKISGRRACDLVRSGKQVELSPRDVNIISLQVLAQTAGEENSRCRFRVVCSKGTYVRSLARDIAKKLGTLAYVEELRRTKSGFFSLKNAFTLEKLEEIKDTVGLVAALSPMESPLDDIPALYLDSDQVTRLQNGLRVQLSDCCLPSSNVLIFDNGFRKFRGIGNISADGEMKAVRMCAYGK